MITTYGDGGDLGESGREIFTQHPSQRNFSTESIEEADEYAVCLGSSLRNMYQETSHAQESVYFCGLFFHMLLFFRRL